VSAEVRTDVHDGRAACEATLNLLSRENAPTAIVAMNNRISLGTLKAIYGAQSDVALHDERGAAQQLAGSDPAPYTEYKRCRDRCA
jgi:hypothetical protein